MTEGCAARLNSIGPSGGCLGGVASIPCVSKYTGRWWSEVGLDHVSTSSLAMDLQGGLVRPRGGSRHGAVGLVKRSDLSVCEVLRAIVAARMGSSMHVWALLERYVSNA